LGTLLALGAMMAVIGWLKSAALVNYLEQRHHVFVDVPTSPPALRLPPQWADWLTSSDAYWVDVQNTVFHRETAMLAGRGSILSEAQAAPKVPSEPAPAEATAVTAPESTHDLLNITADDQVLFCGDSLMQGLAPIMATQLRHRKIAFRNLSRQSTGLAYPSYFDWPKTIREELAAHHASVLIIFIGANDAWDLMQHGKMLSFDSGPWREVYRQRVESIVAMAEEAKARVIWVSLPPMENKRLVARAPVLNALYQDVLSQHPDMLLIPASQVLTEDGSTFARYKKNSSGVVQLLRADDGIHLAPAGNRLLSDLILKHVKFL
jgi:hypothetical protein